MEKNKSAEISREIINAFLEFYTDEEDFIHNCLSATMAQFITITAKKFAKLQNTEFIAENIIELQIFALRKCIIDLERYKTFVTEGVSVQ